MESPPTPEHVQPDVEVNIPSESVSLDLDLNPEWDEDDAVSQNNNNGYTHIDNDENAQKANSLPPVSDGSIAPTPEYSPPHYTISLWTLPFDEALELLKQEFENGQRHQPISLSQQSKFVNYVDLQLLQIQRKFIKNQSEAAITYSLSELLDELAPVIDLIWFLLLDHASLFGQEEYYIKILGDLDDWVAYYTFPLLAARLAAGTAFYVKIFALMQKIDTHISFLLDGYESPTGLSKMSATEMVRLSPIVLRLRLSIIEKLEETRSFLSAFRSEPANDEMLNILDVEIGRLFEGVLERV